MPLVFGCIVPHGSVIPGTSGAELTLGTTAAMESVGRRLETAHPDIVVVVTPHGIRVDGAMAISRSERAEGSLEETIRRDGEEHPVHVEFAVDQAFAAALHERAVAAQVPAVTVHYGATTGPHDCYPLDWGAVVPLWFLGAHFNYRPRIVLVVPSRALPLNALVRFGHAVAEAAEASGHRLALVASADLAHAHTEDGPYGFDTAAVDFDEWITAVVKSGDLGQLEHADMGMVERACPDGLWQILVLAGALQRCPLEGEFLSYERPTYYGMLTAVYAPAASHGMAASG